MYSKLTISEREILRFIAEQFNDNSFGVKFSIADWFVDNANSLLINRKALDFERFDKGDIFDENTYAKQQYSFVAMSVNSLNGEFLALNKIKQVVYDTSIDFLICSEYPNVLLGITTAIEEVRKKLLQYFTTFKVSYIDLNNQSSTTQIDEILKVITMTGSIDYGQEVKINGKGYLTYSLPITMLFTNFGEFANQNKLKLGVSDVQFGQWANSNEAYWNLNGQVGSAYDVTLNIVGSSPYSQYLPSPTNLKHGIAGRVNHLINNYYVLTTTNTNYTDTVSGTYATQTAFNNYLTTNGFATLANVGKIYRGLKTTTGYWYAIIIHDRTVEYYNVTGNGVVKMFDIEPIEWHWGTTTSQETTQLLRDKDLLLEENSYEVKSLSKSKSYAFSCDLQIDLKNELLRKLYKDSKIPKGTIDTWYLQDITEEYDEIEETYVIAEDLSVTRELELIINQPNESLSKGEKIVFTLAFAPKLKTSGE